MANFNWICPFCEIAQTVSDSKYDNKQRHIDVLGNEEGSFALQHQAITCCNNECKKTKIVVWTQPDIYHGGGYKTVHESVASNITHVTALGAIKHYPDFIPAPLRDDYREACLIKDLSPKASATLIRRCLQGMIRDFCGISKPRLIDEITTLRKNIDDGTSPGGVTIESVDAIDHVRSIGNIGAHMEKDIDMIVDVEPGEAQLLIELVETLFEEWYINRHRRQQRFASIAAISEQKKQEIANLKAAAQLTLSAPTMDPEA